MRILLTEDVVGLGDIGETVKVKSGYARNFLIPRGAALELGSKSVRAVEHSVREIEAKKKRLQVDAEKLADELRNVSVELGLRVGSGGKVFGSIAPRDIAAKLKELGYETDRRRVLLSEPIKKLGTHFVKVKLHPEVSVQVKVVIEKVEATKEEEAKETEQARAEIEAAAEEIAAESSDSEVEESSVESSQEQEVESKEEQ